MISAWKEHQQSLICCKLLGTQPPQRKTFQILIHEVNKKNISESFVNYENDRFVTHIANHYCQCVICLLTIFLETKCYNFSTFSKTSYYLVFKWQSREWVWKVISLLFWFAHPRLMIFEHFLTYLTDHLYIFFEEISI